jgi:hypothetical protein
MAVRSETKIEPKPRLISGTVGQYGFFVLILAAGLLTLFWRSFSPDETLFSNDGPYGGMMAEHTRADKTVTGYWQDLNWLGSHFPAPSPTPSTALRLLTSPLVFSKFFYPVALLILGSCAWFAFWRWKLSPVACVLGGVAAALSGHFLSTACWGVAAQVICVAMNFLAIGLVADCSSRRRWVSTALAGMAVGMGVMEGYDIGAIFSIFVAAFVLYHSWAATSSQPVSGLAVGKPSPARALIFGIVKVAVVAAFAAFLATQAVSTLVGTQIKNVAGMQQDPETKARRWIEATQWSLPPEQTLQLSISGLFGYRMDTPKDMAMGADCFKDGKYWGRVGEGAGISRFSGGGEYAGLLVVAIAFWAALQSLRKNDSVFAPLQRRLIWFWIGAAIISLLLAFGHYAPFYQFVYMLPYFSTIRNPAKFTHPLHFALIILFAYGIDGLWHRYLTGTTAQYPSLKAWWAKVKGFDRKWTIGSVVFIGVSIFGLLAYASSKPELERFLTNVGFPEPSEAARIASFSLQSAAWFILILMLAIALLTLILSGRFAGRRATWGAALLGLFLVVDLVRADLPWVIYQNYKIKNATNPLIDVLRDKPYEHRVASLPSFFSDPDFMKMVGLPTQLAQLQAYFDHGICAIEWKQHVYQYYNIQSLEVVQMPRQPQDLLAYEGALQPRRSSLADISVMVLRRWQLSNTRYFVGAADFLGVLNQLMDPAQHRFRIVQRYDLAPKPEFPLPDQSAFEQWTVVPATNGALALFEFTGALPRAKLYPVWQVNTNDSETLAQLASPSFDPEKSVIVAGGVQPPASVATNQPAGKVEFASYAPKNIVFKAESTSPSILLLNDHFDPNWKVFVDGKPETVLRCNYIMRGVFVPPGPHTVQFSFQPSVTPLHVSLSAIVLGLILSGILIGLRDENRGKGVESAQPIQSSAVAKPVVKPRSS